MQVKIVDNEKEYIIPLPYSKEYKDIKTLMKELHNVENIKDMSIIINEYLPFERAMLNFYNKKEDYTIDILNEGLTFYYENIYLSAFLRELCTQAVSEIDGGDLLQICKDILKCDLINPQKMQDFFIIKQALGKKDYLLSTIYYCSSEKYIIYNNTEEAVKTLLKNSKECNIFTDEQINYILNGVAIEEITDYYVILKRMMEVTIKNKIELAIIPTMGDVIVVLHIENV
jgi:hypothetical protein